MGEGVLTVGGPLAVRTNKTGRRPRDRFIVEDDLTRGAVWWGGFNTPVKPEVFERLLRKMTEYASGRELFVQDLSAGTDSRSRLPVRFVQEMVAYRRSKADGKGNPLWPSAICLPPSATFAGGP